MERTLYTDINMEREDRPTVTEVGRIMGTGDWCHPTTLKITRQLLKEKDGDKTMCPGRCQDKTFRYSSDTFNDSCFVAVQLPSF